ncbi:uncharacterized protein LOC123004143 [Tribolium madens]|uniref:uncharacterized protein LOC123004143 n=1 Tax=Tribolium madens TaxID=41895 RepID=UPI001CF7247B|nr:uncharacterized protein LOC123004143 [Tribolium madens]
MSKICIFLIIFAVTEARFRRDDDCQDEIVINPELCSPDYDNEAVMSVTNSEKILKSELKTKCEYDSKSSVWYINDDVKKKNAEEFTIVPSELDLGITTVQVEMEVKRGDQISKPKLRCYIKTVTQKLNVVIEGGTSRTVDEGSDFVMDGTKTNKYQLEPSEEKDWKFKWECSLQKGTNSDFCKKKYTGSTLTVPAKFALKNHVYKFTLNVRASDQLPWEEATQVVTITKTNCKDRVTIDPKFCTPNKNQPFDLTKSQVLEGKFTSNCDVYSKKFEWYLNGKEHSDGTQFQADKKTLSEGLNEIKLVTEVNRLGKILRPETICYIKLTKPPLKPIIQGGTSRTVDEGSSFVMDGSQSLDDEGKPNSSGRLEYKWQCVLEKGPFDNFCQHIYRESTITVPAEYSIGGSVYKFTLSVKMDDDVTWDYKTDQIVTIPQKQPTGIKIKSCQVTPKTGTAVKTKFKVGCQYTGDAASFEVYTVKQGKNVPLVDAVRIEDLEFLLPSDVEVFIRIKDIEDSSDESKLNVKVQSASSEITSLTQNVKDLVNDKQVSKAVQIANGIIEEIESNPNEKNREIKQDLLKTFVETKVESHEDAQQIYSIVSRIVYNPDAESDPFQGELATKACKNNAKIDFTNLKSKHFPKKMAKEIRTNAKILMNCGVTDTKPNQKQLEQKRLDFNVTTPFPVVTLPVITEEYQDYDANDNAASKAQKYEEASRNYIDICKTTLEMLALTSIKDTIMTSTVNVSAQVTRSQGWKLLGREIKISGATFSLSQDLDTNDLVDVMVCSWRRNPFWWMGWVVVTNVVLVKVSKMGQDLVHFNQPLKMVLEVHQNRKEEIVVHEIVNGGLTVVRIEVKAGQSFFVKFLQTTSDFRVLLTEFEKPSLSMVQNGQLVQDGQVLYQEKVSGYDAWWYISSVSGGYHLSVYTMSCYQWNVSRKIWVFACRGGANSSGTQIECLCNHLSILSGIVYNNPIKVENNVTEPDFQMVLIRSPIIFICVATIVALYSVSLILVVKERVKTMIIYVPSDISSYSRYPYLVLIQTGKKPSSGTSSNVCIKIFGELDSSQSHVLNYPDPHKRMFQWGTNDWFLIPTRSFLGQDLEIALWIDYTGRSPSWYCLYVIIYDLQASHKWYFKINQWLDLPPRGNVYIKIPASEETKQRKFSMVRLLPRRSYQTDFDFFTKMTLLLSIVLMVYLTCLVMYGVPQLELSDGFAWYCHYGFHWEPIAIGFGCSGVTFLTHMIWVWFYRRAKLVSLVILTANIVTSVTILVVFGFWEPPIMSWFWFTSVVLALMVYFLVLENLSEVFWKKNGEKFVWTDHLSRLFREVETQRRYLFRKFGENVLRAYFGHLYQPMDISEIKKRKHQIFSRFKILALLEDTIMFSCYIILLYLAIYANKNPQTILNHGQFQNLMAGYSNITSISGYYRYLNMTFAPTLHLQQWYSKYVVDAPGTMSDFCNKFLGVVRLRQKRVIKYQCKVPSYLKFAQTNSCRSEFWYSMESHTNFSYLAQFRPIWNYTIPELAGITVVVGKFGIYDGGGFVSPLGRTLYNTYVNINYMVDNKWIDGATSAIFLEFLAYNVNTNLFNVIRLVTELSTTGFFRNKLELDTVQLLFVRDEDSIVQVVIFGAFIVIVFVFTLKILTRIWQGKGLVMFQDLWIVVDLIIVGMSYGCFVSFVYRTQLVKEFLSKMEKVKKNQFINYFHLVYAELTFTLVAALLVFVSTVRLWKLCRFGTVFQIMEKTLASSIVSILSLFVSHICFIVAFTFLGCLIFGFESDDFKDMADSSVSLMRLSTRLINSFNVDHLIRLNPVLGNVFFTSYMMINQLLVSLYVSIIIICYHKAVRVNTSHHDFTNLKQFVSKEVNYYKTSFQVAFFRLRAGRGKNFVSPKPDEIRYENCLTLSSNTLELMRCIVWYDLKKYTMSGREKLELMERVVGTCRASPNEFFFTGKAKRRIRIIHDERIRRVAAATQLILFFDVERKKRQEERVKLVLKQQEIVLDYVLEVLKTVLTIVSNIDVE